MCQQSSQYMIGQMFLWICYERQTPSHKPRGNGPTLISGGRILYMSLMLTTTTKALRLTPSFTGSCNSVITILWKKHTKHHFFLLTLSQYSVGTWVPESGIPHSRCRSLFKKKFLLPRTEFVIDVQKEYCGLVESTVARQLSDIKENQNISAASLFKAFTK